MEVIKLTLNEERNVTLTGYLQTPSCEYGNISKRPAIIVLPGGGYQYCSDREADPVAFPYLQVGYQVFILRYSVGQHSCWPNPLSDYESAMNLIQENSEEWMVDLNKVAVIGFSAGGHLAAACACMAEHKPSACILGYPVITKETVNVYCPTAPGIPENVNKDTSPCFVFTTRTDATVPVENTVKLVDALTKNDVPYECHIYSYANHGFTTCESCVQNRSWICSRAPSWVRDSIEWLKEVIGDF